MNNLAEQVLAFSRTPHFGCEITGLAELAPGIIAAKDTLHECDAYFDLKRWNFAHPAMWQPGPGTTYGRDRLELRDVHHIEILPGLVQLPQATTFAAMLDMAKRCLCPQPEADVSWHNAPREFAFSHPARLPF